MLYAQWPVEIKSAEDLMNIKNHLEKSYILTEDISLTGEWEPIGINGYSPFTGILDGNSHTINNLNIVNENFGYIGLIGYNEGTIRNLNLGVKIISDEENYDGKESIAINATEDIYIGGIVGYNSEEGIIKNCKIAVDINLQMNNDLEKDAFIGGVAGYNNGKVSHNKITCKIYSDISEEIDIYEGSLIGKNDVHGIIDFCNYTRLLDIDNLEANACGNDLGIYENNNGSNIQINWNEL